MALYLVLLSSSYSNAQVDPTTGNLINSGTTPTDTTSVWNNGVYVNQLCFQAGQPGNCGPNPSVRAASGNINFSYGTTDLNQIVNINRALSAGGTGVQLSGFNFSFMAKNGNGWDDARQDYLAAYVKFYNAGGGLAANYDYSADTNRKYNWTQFNFSETFASPQLASQYSNAQVGFVGRDNNFWAGNYGPEIYNVSFSLKYRVDPCATNPAYSSTCTGFNTVINSANLFNSSLSGSSMNQVFAINTALGLAGSGAMVHGINYGFNYTVGQGFSGCTATNQDGSCSWYMNTPAYVSASMTLRNSDNQVINQRNYSFTQEGTSGSVSEKYLLPSSMNQTLLGTARLTASASGSGSSISGAWANIIYTADPCATNPLSSPNCSGYGAAFAKQLTASNTTSTVSTTSTLMALNTSPMDQSNPQQEPTQQQQQSQPQQQQQSGPSPQPDSGQNPSVASADPAQPSPTQAGPASTSPQPAGGPPQATQTASSSSSSSSGPGGSSAGPSKLAMSVLKTAQEKDKATQNAAVQAAAKTLEGSMQSSQASSNLAISLNQDMSANSAVSAAAFASQTTQASQQTATQSSQGPQQTAQASTQTTSQSSKLSSQEQQSQQETQQAQVQSSSNDAQYQAPKQQETQQAQVQTSTSVVRLMQPQQQETQQAQTQSTSVVQYQAPQQQEQQQAQSQTSTSVVKLLPPQQEQQQTQTQMTAGMMTMPQSAYTPPQQTQDTQSTQITVLRPPSPPVVEVQQQASSGTGLTISRNMFAYNPLMSSNSSSQSMQQQQPQPVFQQRIDQKQFEVDTPQMSVASFSGSRAGNPLSEIMMQQRFEMMQNNIAQPESSVNKNVQPNELAKGVDIATMATIPVGFSAYSIVLKDSAFYEPKEVYKNQKTVDNERVLRGLTRGSDALHQRMVDQQYKVGN